MKKGARKDRKNTFEAMIVKHRKWLGVGRVEE